MCDSERNIRHVYGVQTTPWTDLSNARTVSGQAGALCGDVTLLISESGVSHFSGLKEPPI